MIANRSARLVLAAVVLALVAPLAARAQDDPARCGSCTSPLPADQDAFFVRGKLWCESCFKCKSCTDPLAGSKGWNWRAESGGPICLRCSESYGMGSSHSGVIRERPRSSKPPEKMKCGKCAKEFRDFAMYVLINGVPRCGDCTKCDRCGSRFEAKFGNLVYYRGRSGAVCKSCIAQDSSGPPPESQSAGGSGAAPGAEASPSGAPAPAAAPEKKGGGSGVYVILGVTLAAVVGLLALAMRMKE